MARPVEKAAIGAPGLKPADINNAEAAVLTIATAVQKESAFPDGSGKKPLKTVLSFTEVPEREMWLGKKAHNLLCDRYGLDLDRWLGQRCAVVVVFANVKGQQQKVVQVAEDFYGVLKEFAKRGKK